MALAEELLDDNPPVLRSDKNGVATLKLNRSGNVNTLSTEMLAALQGTCEVIAEDRSVRAVVLASTGHVFCAGHDLKEMRAHPEEEFQRELFSRCGRMMVFMHEMPQPIIAKVQGVTSAAGCDLVANCDLAVASEKARFSTCGINLGLFCTPPGVSYGRVLPRKHALDLLMTGDSIPAREALKIGLINRVVPADELDSATNDLAEELAAKDQDAMALGKRAFYQQIEMSMADAYEFSARETARNMTFDQTKETIDDFLGKRRPLLCKVRL